MKIIFFGSSIYSLPTLEYLIKTYSVVAVVTQPNRPVGRKQIATPTPVAQCAQKNKIPILKPESVKEKPWVFQDDETLSKNLHSFKAELLISCYFGQKIPSKILGSVPFHGINIHPSLLPSYRGAAPSQWAIVMGEKETGISLISMDSSFDTGQIIAQEKIPITPTDTAQSLYGKLFAIAPALLENILPDYLSGQLGKKGIQNGKESYFPRLCKNDGFVPFSIFQKSLDGQMIQKDDLLRIPLIKYFPSNPPSGPQLIERMIRGFFPWPGVWTEIKMSAKGRSSFGRKKLKIIKGHVNEEKFVPDVVQVEGKNPVKWEQFRKGYPDIL